MLIFSPYKQKGPNRKVQAEGKVMRYDMEWIPLAQDRDKGRAMLDTIINLSDP